MPQPLRYNPASDYYKVLGVQPTATNDEITRVFRQRAKEVHPDVNPHRREWAHQEFQRINTAYEVLSNAELRAQYDKLRIVFLTQAFSNPPRSQTPPPRSSQSSSYRPAERPQKQSRIPIVSLLVALSVVFRVLATSSSSSYGNSNYRGYDSSTNFAATLAAFQYSYMTLDPTLLAYYPELYGSPQPTRYYRPAIATSTPTWAPYQNPDCTDPDVQITFPAFGAVLNLDYLDSIYGSATGAGFKSYKVEFGPVRHNASSASGVPDFIYQAIKEQSVQKGMLVKFSTPVKLEPDTVYAVRVKVVFKNDIIKQCETRFSTAPTEP